MDEDRHEVRRAGEVIDLSPTEFALLRYLMLNSGRVLSKAQILDHVWRLRLRRRQRHRRELHLLPAQEDRPDRPAVDPHPARRGVLPTPPPLGAMSVPVLHHLDVRGWSLRRRLVAGLVLLTALAIIAVGFAASRAAARLSDRPRRRPAVPRTVPRRQSHRFARRSQPRRRVPAATCRHRSTSCRSTPRATWSTAGRPRRSRTGPPRTSRRFTAEHVADLDGKVVTVPSTTGGSDYRARALPLDDGTSLVVAVSLKSVDSTVQRLALLITALGPRGAAAHRRPRPAWSFAPGLRPLEGVEAHRRGDRHRRPDPSSAAGAARHRGREALRLAQRHAPPDRERVPRPGGLRGAAAPLRRRREPRAAHTADDDPRLCRAVPAGRGHRPRGADARHGTDRDRVGPDGPARRRPAPARPPRPAAAARARAGRSDVSG